MPTADYHMAGGYTVSKTGEFTAEGSVADETNARIIARLAELGFIGTVEDSGEQPKERGILDCLVDALNENAGDGERWERRYTTPQMECGDGRWRGLDGRFAGAASVDPEPDEALGSGTARQDKSGLQRLYTLDTPRGEIFIAEEFITHGEYFSTALGTVYSYGDDRTFALVTSRKAGDWDPTKIKRDFRESAEDKDGDEASAKSDVLTIEMPLDGFTPEKIDNLIRLVNAKAPLLKAALGTDELPIRQNGETLQFPWFSGNLDAEHTAAYSTLISLLCQTAIKKTRVTARERETYDSPKYAMRCFLLALGMIGDEYKTTRKILLSQLEGNSSYAKPPVKEGDPGDEAAEAV
jgi:hypothetical protein